MRRITFGVALGIAILAPACGNVTEPMACQGNPKCTADATPKPPTALLPIQMTPSTP